MTEEQKQRVRDLVAALRSGEYIQAQNALRKDGGFCCLGVACDLHLKATADGSWAGTIYHTPKGSSQITLPLTVRNWYGFLTSNPEFPDPRGSGGLASIVATQANDELNLTFPQIADLLEQQYLPDDYVRRLTLAALAAADQEVSI